ncbi:MAG: cobyrinate a,c-diamide synthase [Lachnospiraceae bacterium]|nr:cobyrinate a,c-diamide synthase [Lachnospiraceae bacterium]
MTNKINIPRIMIAAPASGSGKTLFTCALLQYCISIEKQVHAFKCGPDYIDPMFHQKILGIPSRNLDAFLAGSDHIQQQFIRTAKTGDLAVLEGVMGLFDGMGGTTEEASCYQIATLTDTPIILVMRTKGMGGPTLLATIKGYLDHDPMKRIKGIILNQTSKSYYQMVKVYLEKETGVPVLGYMPEDELFQIESRHLGLQMPGEISNFKRKFQVIGEAVSKTVDMDQIVQIAKNTAPLVEDNNYTGVNISSGPRIGIARDEAFCFYYEDNIELLRQMGAELVYFSPLHDKKLPENLQGIILGGGYPEIYAKELQENAEMRRAIYSALADGLPSIAECGGFLYLQSMLWGTDGELYEMAGVLPGTGKKQEKLVRFGYVTIESNVDSFLEKGEKIRGHEFHYYDCEENGTDCLADKPVTGRSWNCIYAGENHWWGFPHLYFPSNPQFVKRFLSEGKKTGTLYGVGVGPGDPELITLKALHCIQNADLIILPALQKETCTAYKIVEQIYPDIRKKNCICLDFPMIRDEEKLHRAHDENYHTIKQLLEKYEKIAFLVLGDPSIYATYSYMRQRLQKDGSRSKTISGVPSFCAAASALGVSLVDQKEQLHILPGDCEVGANIQGTRVYMKSGKELEIIKEKLRRESQKKKLNIYGVSNCGMPEEKLVNSLKDIDPKSSYFTLLIVKEYAD